MEPFVDAVDGKQHQLSDDHIEEVHNLNVIDDGRLAYAGNSGKARRSNGSRVLSMGGVSVYPPFIVEIIALFKEAHE